MELYEFLKLSNLLQYHQALLDNGVEELEILMELTENHLERIGFKIGHIIKVQKAAQRFKASGIPSCENYKLVSNSFNSQNLKIPSDSFDWNTEKVLKTTSLKLTKPDADHLSNLN